LIQRLKFNVPAWPMMSLKVQPPASLFAPQQTALSLAGMVRNLLVTGG